MRAPAASRIAVTGIGPVCPEAIGVAELRSARLPFPGDVPRPRSMARFAPERFFGKRGFKFLSPATRYALAAAQLALEDAGLLEGAVYGPESRGVFVGTNFGVHEVLEGMDGVVLSQGSGALLAMETPNFSVNIPASYVSLKLGFLAFNVTLTNMLVAGLEAVAMGAQSIRSGRAQLVLAGAAEGPIPAGVSAPLGGAASEGAACMLTLEALPAAEDRGARVYAEIGASVLAFVPPEAAASDGAWASQEPTLRRHVDRMIEGGCPSDLVLFDIDSPLVRRVNESLRHQVLDRWARPPRSAAAPEASASPVLSLAASLASGADTLAGAVSPTGHVVLLSLESAVGEVARAGPLRHAGGAEAAG